MKLSFSIFLAVAAATAVSVQAVAQNGAPPSPQGSEQLVKCNSDAECKPYQMCTKVCVSSMCTGESKICVVKYLGCNQQPKCNPNSCLQCCMGIRNDAVNSICTFDNAVGEICGCRVKCKSNADCGSNQTCQTNTGKCVNK
ncbi:hypothetical protein GQ42DRAFT_66702 [Ramicandelaber brevisporus]|nr:hypothetical protein GQ42DRAFT_66702 [Ramicandelaber brevisporus]